MAAASIRSLFPRAHRRLAGGARFMRGASTALVAVSVVLAGLVGLSAGADDPPLPPRLPELVRTKQTVFSLPFRVAPPQSPDRAATRVVLSVSRDLGATWQEVGTAAPAAGSIVYKASIDGEYWFRFRAIDAQGRARGGEGPDLRVLVDAAGPRLTARVWRGGDGEIVCRYAAADDSLRLESLEFSYRGKGDTEWKRIAAEGILARESPAHLVGEEIWWAGERVEALTVRIAVADGGGNRTVKEFHLEPADPGIDQANLALELGVPSLPTQPVPTVEPSEVGRQVEIPVATAMPGAASAARGWDAEAATRFSVDPPAPVGGTEAPSVLLRPVSASPVVTAPAGPLLPARQRAPAAPLSAPRVVQPPTEYRGKPLHIVNSRRFTWDYEIESDRPAGGPLQVELWSTLDGGVTWQRSAIDDDATSPIDVALPAVGLYGFRLEIVPAQPAGGPGPRSGAAPEGWIGVDDEPPVVDLIQVDEVRSGGPTTVVIRYAARDQLLVPRGVRLLYSPSVEGPWATITDGLDAQGEHRWQPDRVVPPRVYIRAEATDAAGNVGRTTTPEPVATTVSRVVGRLGGVRVTPPSPAP
ncbi:MAG: hypothetical protein EBR86_07625 [Planctomycetia bacterium]|nr:hypothetical protein [Planctomycetia bacterium]